MYPSFRGQHIKNPCAYCAKYGKYLSPRQVKERKCLEKQCWRFNKMPHSWWEQKAVVRQRKIDKKERQQRIGYDVHRD